jgi:hypothetical protein
MTLLRRTLPEQPQHILDDLGSGLWSVVVPEGSTNLVTNPSFENGVTGWVAGGTGASVTRSATYSAFGGASMLFADASASGGEYASTNNIDVSASTVYTWSFYWRKVAAVSQTGTYRVDFYTGGSVLISSVTGTFPPGNIGDWRRTTLTFVTPATTAYVVLVYLAPSSGAYSLYVDGVQLEQKAYATTYIDGDQPGCYWAGAAQASSSSRSATTRQGGRVIPFRNFNWRTTALIGLQVAALNTITTPYALIGGGYYQRSIAPPRAFTIVGGFDCASQIELSRARSDLARYLSPFRTSPEAPVRLIYEPAGCEGGLGKRIVIDAVYTGGLEGNQTNDAGIERHALGFRVHLPFAALGTYELDTSVPLDFEDVVTSAAVFRRNIATGALSAVPGFAAFATDAVSSPTEGVYVTGRTLSAPDVRVGLWNGSSAVALGGGGLTGGAGEGRAVLRDLDGTIIFGGDFLFAGGVGAANVARYDPSAGTYSAMSTGLGAKVYSLVMQAGIPFAGGSFTSPANYMAGWDGAAWVAAGTGLNGTVWAMAARPGTNDVFVGGAFTTPNTRFAIWRIGTGWVAAGAGLNGIVYDLVIGPDGSLYACGAFSQDVIGNQLNYIARWTGAGWQPLGNGLAGICESMAFDSNGILYTVSQFRMPDGSASPTTLSAWNGSSWYSPGFQPSFLPATLEKIRAFGGYDHFVGATAGYKEAGHTTITNTGALVNPKIVVTGGGIPASIVNMTTGVGIYLNYAVGTGEIVTITTGATPSVISNTAGDISSYLRPGSQVAEFALLSGDNDIAVFITANTVGTSATLVYRSSVTGLDEAVR